MTRALWRALPGPVWLRTTFMVLVAVAALIVCFELLFPWIARSLPVNEQTVGR